MSKQDSSFVACKRIKHNLTSVVVADGCSDGRATYDHVYGCPCECHAQFCGLRNTMDSGSTPVACLEQVLPGNLHVVSWWHNLKALCRYCTDAFKHTLCISRHVYNQVSYAHHVPLSDRKYFTRPFPPFMELHRTHKSPVLSHMHSVQRFPPYFPKIHSNIILPSMPRSSECPFPSCFPLKMLYTFLISHLCATWPTHPLRLDHPNIWWRSSLCSLLQPPAFTKSHVFKTNYHYLITIELNITVWTTQYSGGPGLDLQPRC